MISGFHVEVLLASGYSVFLVAAAFLLEFLARHSLKRSAHYRNSGFRYFRKMDLWECPAGRQLTRSEIDHHRRIVYYRAPADDCNACSLKSNCTDSNDGRVLESRLDTWLESELRHFHRGLSLALLFLATLILAAEIARHAAHREVALAGSLLVAIGVLETKLFSAFLASHPRN